MPSLIDSDNEENSIQLPKKDQLFLQHCHLISAAGPQGTYYSDTNPVLQLSQCVITDLIVPCWQRKDN